MKWPVWISHLWEKLVLSHLSALWGSGLTSRPASLNCPVLHPCTRKCWVEVREKGEKDPGLLGWIYYIYCIIERSTGFIIVKPVWSTYEFLNTNFSLCLSNAQKSLGIQILYVVNREGTCTSQVKFARILITSFLIEGCTVHTWNKVSCVCWLWRNMKI